MKRTLLAVALAASALAGHAQEATVGKLSDVSGSVLVSADGKVSQGVQGMALTSRTTIMVGNGAKATVALNGACSISLKANQHLVLDSALTCAQQTAAVKQLMTPYRVAQAPVGGAAVGGGVAGGAAIGTSLAIAGGIVAVGAVAISTTDTVPVSGQ